jgi:hypothetical protein
MKFFLAFFKTLTNSKSGFPSFSLLDFSQCTHSWPALGTNLRITGGLLTTFKDAGGYQKVGKSSQ